MFLLCAGPLRRHRDGGDLPGRGAPPRASPRPAPGPRSSWGCSWSPARPLLPRILAASPVLTSLYYCTPTFPTDDLFIVNIYFCPKMLSIFSNHQRIQNLSKYLSKSSTARSQGTALLIWVIADCPYAATTTKEGIRCPLVIYIFISPQSGFNISLNSTRPHLLSSDTQYLKCLVRREWIGCDGIVLCWI